VVVEPEVPIHHEHPYRLLDQRQRGLESLVVPGLLRQVREHRRQVRACADCERDHAIRSPALVVPAAREPEGTPRSACGDCGARISLLGKALDDGLCRMCREDRAPDEVPDVQVSLGLVPCPGWDGVPFGREALPNRSVCVRQRAQDLAAAGAKAC
jgi:hypothetical protein